MSDNGGGNGVDKLVAAVIDEATRPVPEFSIALTFDVEGMFKSITLPKGFQPKHVLPLLLAAASAVASKAVEEPLVKPVSRIVGV